MELGDKMSFQSMVATGDVNLVLSLLDRTKKEDTSNLPQNYFCTNPWKFSSKTLRIVVANFTLLFYLYGGLILFQNSCSLDSQLCKYS